ncbi:MAG: M23 family metallopeptidase [Methylophilaceae bacterium]
MNIILVSNKMAKAKNLSIWQTLGLLFMLVLLSVMLTLLFITPKVVFQEQGVKAMLPMQLKNSINSTQLHLDAYAKELGELQARIMRLDAQNERLAKMASEKDGKHSGADAKNNKPAILNSSKTINPDAIKPATDLQLPNRGGPLVNARPMTESELKQEIEALINAVDERDVYLSKVEAKVLQQSVLKDMLPNSSPINAAYNSSSYGWRIDPFTGTKAFHEGLDFSADTGTVIRAAADGIVSLAEVSGGYGNLIKIEHGSGLETRYGHASKLFVKAGDRVVKGQKIAEVGNTGRSTGPHLHYEIRLNGNALDPREYLQKNAG